jgi:AraC-like DNA-binding protein
MTTGHGAASVLAGPARIGAGTAVPDAEAPFEIEFLPPPAIVDPYVATFFSIRCDRPVIRDVQPATIGMLIVTLKGRARLRMRDGKAFDSHQTSLLTPLSAAAQVDIEGPWHAFGATITPLGWAALTGGLSAAQWSDRMVKAGSLLGAEVSRLGECLARGHHAGLIDAAGMVAKTAQVLAARAMPVPPRHAQAIRAVAEWLGSSLSPRLDDLVLRTRYSARQMQRLVDRYYGLPPKHLARKYRALRAAALLGQSDTPADLVAHVEEQFYDQSHMIREIRLFAGCTPGRLTRSDQPVMSASLDVRNFAGIMPQVAAIPPGLRRAVGDTQTHTLSDRYGIPR